MRVFGLKDLQAGKMSRLIEEGGETLIAEWHKAKHVAAGEHARELTASIPQPTGNLHAGWVDAVRRVPDGKQVRIGDYIGPVGRIKAFKLKPGQSSAVGNIDAGAAAIDFGRRRNNYPGYSRQGGSAAAPTGLTRPMLNRSLATDKAHQAVGIAAAERKLR